MNKRDAVLNLLNKKTDYIPAAFFMHFDDAYREGQAAVEKHLEFFRYTGMDFVKIQYEHSQPPSSPIRRPEDWAQAPLYSDEFFEMPVKVVEGLVKAARAEALVVMTLYSPFMWATHLVGADLVAAHLKEKPEAVVKGLAIMTENVLKLVRACQRAGVDGFYVATQGGEAFRFPDTDIFEKYIKPTDLAVWAEIQTCSFNILHICDYEGGYADLTPFLDYPGHVVNCNLKLREQTLTAREVSEKFRRPFMGGLDRKGIIATGIPETIQQTVTGVLAKAPERFILGADCTIPNNTPWKHLKIAIDVAHQYQKE
jgi:uroporphyrinogen decarboxylase